MTRPLPEAGPTGLGMKGRTRHLQTLIRCLRDSPEGPRAPPTSDGGWNEVLEILGLGVAGV